MIVVLWLIFLAVCIIVEIVNGVSLATIWFIPGAIVAAILAALNVPAIIQIIVFLILSVISLFITRKFVKTRHNTKHLEKTNADLLIGKTTRLLEDCSPNKNSSVKFGDIVWTAKSIDGETLLANTLVTVVRIEGNTLIIKKGE